MERNDPEPDDRGSQRKHLRKELRARRAAVSREVRATVVQHVRGALDGVIAARNSAGLEPPKIAFYWPIHGELSLVDLMKDVAGQELTVLLPVVTGPDEPLEFREWTRSTPMRRGAWNIPEPAEGKDVTPDVLLVPLVGFDERRYRLGNGGGYYDRTLASRVPRPRAIGIGFEVLRLPTIHPEPHDVPMDLILTEADPDLDRIASWWD
ncbi:MAG: 5-formyltetrahydrofolate cyclo-ligase [Planctomycetes bacterium]|nr:5-formyltetrahydrofolate cyclo-ligase [Planctomycetota bacterium]